MEMLGGRKFLYAVCSTVLLAGLVYLGKLDGGQFVTAFGIVGGGYLAANAVRGFGK